MKLLHKQLGDWDAIRVHRPGSSSNSRFPHRMKAVGGRLAAVLMSQHSHHFSRKMLPGVQWDAISRAASCSLAGYMEENKTPVTVTTAAVMTIY